MKKIIFLFALLFLIIIGCEKENETNNSTVPDTFNKEDYEVMAEQMPEPIGGLKAIQEKVVYPEDAKENGIEGKVYVLVFINEFGDVVKAELIKSAHPVLDSAAINAVKKVSFTPAMHKGKNIKVQVTVPIVFKLSPNK